MNFRCEEVQYTYIAEEERGQEESRFWLWAGFKCL